MKVAFHIPGPLQPLAGGADVVEIEAAPATARDALEQLFARCPALRPRILDEQGALRPHVNVFVGEESIRFTGGLDTPMAGAREVFVIPAVSGGAASGRRRTRGAAQPEDPPLPPCLVAGGRARRRDRT